MTINADQKHQPEGSRLRVSGDPRLALLELVETSLQAILKKTTQLLLKLQQRFPARIDQNDHRTTKVFPESQTNTLYD